MNKDEQIGYHKGAISILLKEREGLTGMLNIVNQLLKVHIEELKKLGVDIMKQPEKKSDDELKSDKL